MKKPVIDLHCDLLSYLTRPNSSIYNAEDMGCAVPFLKEGNVKLQIMAIFAPVESKSHEFGLKQSEIFKNLNEEEYELYRFEQQHLESFQTNENIGMLASVESGSAFCDESMPLKEGFANLERIIDNVGSIMYISFTHHAENRFGGGNYSTAGLKNDGKALIDYLHNRKIAIDFSHTSDALAYDILEYISKENINVPIIASHSNYRPVFEHPRNLPDDIAKEIIHRKGLIGLNFVRAFVNPEKVEALEEHVAHGLDLGAENAICYGTDYFYTKENPDKSRIPFYFKEHENAGCYPQINEVFEQQFGTEQTERISSQNALEFLKRLWK
ncbi:dipeptidase [Kaistella jeonii]|uniref:Peptidase n=1 Tax=Kaistella jeonii TaxID=266749 RepID=A0A0C1D1A5_9FLAO|nr:membrane dipeptidase [Kaistella jeonii]KIA90521.1 peptidase [Kaistella jeonii]SFB71477.1 Zn-dependent dipeptidase, dipeptidase homolog [Kaistella jeonii]VEI94892.1 Membrane dipeptidase (Peptidase family M19) [Kaistella jeonii]